MTSSFDWKPLPFEGIWHHGARVMRPLVAAAPYLTLLCLVLLFYIMSGALVTEKGALFDLPAETLADGDATGPVALVVPVQRDTLVFFDDARYRLGDAVSAASFLDHLAMVMEGSTRKTMLVLADRRVSTGEIMRFASLAREGGVEKVLFAEKKTEADE